MAGDTKVFSVARSVDFRIFYPFIKLDNSLFRITQKNYLGFGVSYHFYPVKNIGYFLEPWIYVIPVARGASNAKLANVAAIGGMVYRPIPLNWLDPHFFGLGGIGWQDPGQLTEMDFYFPIGARATVNLYSVRAPFQDNSLSLVLSGSYYYYFSQLSILKSQAFDMGLAIRGTF